MVRLAPRGTASRRRRFAATALCGSALLTLIGGPAEATTITGSFTATITTGGTSTVDSNGLYGTAGASLVGDMATVNFSYNDGFTETVLTTTYSYANLLQSISVTINGHTVSNTGTTELIEDGSHPFDANASGNIQANTGPLNFSFDTTAPYVYDQLTTQAGLNAYLIGATKGQIFTEGQYYNMVVTSTSGNQPVPEPTSAAILGAGLAALHMVRRRRRYGLPADA